MRKMEKGRGCTCVDCMYGGSIGSEHGGIAPPSNEKGNDEMSEVNPRDFCADAGLSYLDKEPPARTVFGWADIRAEAPTHITAYVVKSGFKECYAKTKEKAFQIASELLLCNDNVEIKRIEIS